MANRKLIDKALNFLVKTETIDLPFTVTSTAGTPFYRITGLTLFRRGFSGHVRVNYETIPGAIVGTSSEILISVPKLKRTDFFTFMGGANFINDSSVFIAPAGQQSVRMKVIHGTIAPSAAEPFACFFIVNLNKKTWQ